MKKTAIFYLILLTFTCTQAQQKNIVKANTAYENYAFIDAISIYEKVVEKGFGTASIYKKLAESYYANANYSLASKWYELYFSNNTSAIEANTYLRYYQSLKSIGNEKKAIEILEIFAQIYKDDSRAKMFLTNKNFNEKIDLNSNSYEVKNEENLNSELSDFGCSFFNDNVVFSSTRNTKENSKSINKWNNQPYSSLYIQQSNSVKDFNLDNTQKHNISSAVFTKDGQTVYYTKNAVNKTKNTKIGNLKIYAAKYKKGTWSEEKELSFNGNYNCAHPTLDQNEKYLYFVSDMPGTFGLSDIFKVEIVSENTFSNPINLGKSINTEGRETFPFMSENGTLYFSSDGHLGHGGLDIFYGEYNSNNGEYAVYNIGTPINSPFDDFAYCEKTNAKSGYFSSNRPNGKGFDDIYSFTLLQNEVLNENIDDLFQIKIQSGTDLAKLFELEDIYFEKSEWEIADEEIFKLQILLEILEQNPNLKIDIRAHTDSRASEQYNLKLSEKRASATKKWLINNGIDSNRLSSKGLGESQLVNHCSDGISCSEDEHKMNRRSEFIVHMKQ
jgi:outer membrane protein OmpA-like peptidoglycan-associated protein